MIVDEGIVSNWVQGYPPVIMVEAGLSSKRLSEELEVPSETLTQR